MATSSDHNFTQCEARWGACRYQGFCEVATCFIRLHRGEIDGGEVSEDYSVEAVRALIDNDAWTDLMKGLVVVAAKCMQRRFPQKKETGEEPADFVSQILTRFFDNTLPPWNPPVSSLAPVNIKSAFFSYLAKHVANAVGNAKKSYASQYVTTDFEGLMRVESADQSDLRIICELERVAVRELLGKESLDYRVAEVIMDRKNVKPREIAVQLGISQDDVYNAYARLRRKLPKLKARIKAMAESG